MTDTPIPAPDLIARLRQRSAFPEHLPRLSVDGHEDDLVINSSSAVAIAALLGEAAAALARPRVPEGREAPPQSVPAQIEAAFRAGYHCQWHDGQYVFDPALSPGDPDGAWAAWQHRAEKAEALAIVLEKAPVIATLRTEISALIARLREPSDQSAFGLETSWLIYESTRAEIADELQRIQRAALAEADAPTEPKHNA